MRSISGKIIDGWYGSIGGFYRVSDGVRDPQYPSDIGGQLTATLKHDLDGGSLMFWYRNLSDKNQWYADFPYIEVNGKAEPYPGFNQLNNTYNSKQLQNFQIPSPGGGFWNDDISNGRGAAMNYFGSNLDLKFDNGWSDHQHLPVRWRVHPHECAGEQRQSPDAGGFHRLGIDDLPPVLSRPRSRPTIQMARPVPLDQSVITEQVWQVRKKLTNVTDEFRVAKELRQRQHIDRRCVCGPLHGQRRLVVGLECADEQRAECESDHIAGRRRRKYLQRDQSSRHCERQWGLPTSSSRAGPPILPPICRTHGKSTVGCSMPIVRLEHIDLHATDHQSIAETAGVAFDLWDNAVDLPERYVLARPVKSTPCRRSRWVQITSSLTI